MAQQRHARGHATTPGLSFGILFVPWRRGCVPVMTGVIKLTYDA